MSATVAMPQKKLLRDLVKAGRWRNESEIIRYGLELVRREVERDSLKPIPQKELAAAYAEMSREELTEDATLGRACAMPTREDL